ncbi:uncharacterized [Tachysurus ichikawai]
MAAGAIELRQENGPLFVCLATGEGQQYNGRHLQGLHYCSPLLGPDPPIFKANYPPAPHTTNCPRRPPTRP